jgi:hypothetical protein
MHHRQPMELRCKVFRAGKAGDLEDAINRFLAEEASAGEVQFEEITQSEGPEGITVVLWYSLADSELDELEEGPDELEEGASVPRELA